MIYLCHTHSDYYDVLNVFLKRYDKYCCGDLVILSNEHFEGRNTFIYSEEMTYKERLISFLETVDCDVCLLHEDFILYDFAKLPKRLYDFDCVRLQKNGNLEYKHIENDFYEIVGDSDRFSITPSIWKSKSLLSFLNRCSYSSIWDLELYEQNTAKDFKIGFVYSEETKVGLFHHYSNYFPCILSAISKGKWNYSEYKNELDLVFDEFGINVLDRGTL